MGELGNKISVCRQNMNLTQEELAKRLGVTAQAVSKWERGVSMPDVSLLTSLCQILEVSGDYLLGLEDKKTKKDSRMQDAFSEKILSNLRNSLEPLELIFGKDITPLFKLKYPALIDGVVPEKISYGLLTQVLKDFLCRGNAMVYLPRVIEFMQYERIKNPGAGVEELTEAIVKGLETENNFWVHMGTR